MSEVLQLNEMHAVLIASKEDNTRKRQEAQDMMAKIAELEKRLEEGVAFTNRYRATKTAATGGLRKRTEALQDLFLKLDHVAKQTSEGYMLGLSSTAEGVREHEGVSAQVTLDLAAAGERLKCLVKRHRECSKQEAKTKHLSAANRSKENEAKELVDRIRELEVQCRSLDEDAVIADAAHREAVKAMESLRAERVGLDQRLEAVVSKLEQSTREIADTHEDMQTAGRAWDGDKASMIREKDSIASDTRAMGLRLSQLSDDASLEERLLELEAEQVRLAEMGPKLSIELGEIQRQCKHDDPKVVELMAQVQEKTQRRQLLADHLAVSRKVLAAHNINTTEFNDRKAEHQELISSIEALRLTQAGNETRKASLEEQTRKATEEAVAATTATKAEIAVLKEDSVRVAAARNEAAAAVTPIQMSVARAQNELALLKGKSEETATTLQNIAALEQDLKGPLCERESDRDKATAQSQHLTLQYQTETESIKRAVEVLGEELEAAKTRAQEEKQRREEVAKQELLTEDMSRMTGKMTAEIEATYAGELKSIQEEIVLEDTRLRAACTEAIRCPTGGGAEERLSLDLSDLHDQEAAMLAEVNAAEARVESLKESERGRLESAPKC